MVLSEGKKRNNRLNGYRKCVGKLKSRIERYEMYIRDMKDVLEEAKT